jgi:benzoate membrane transport protein
MLQPVLAGLLAAFVGFASSFAVVLNGLAATGATPAQAATGLMALCIAMGLGGIVLSLRTRMPVSVAWSTSGAALLASTGAVEGGFPAAIGAFIATGVALTLAGLWRPLTRWVAAIPPALANAMLAGILLGLCLAPVKAVALLPLPALCIIIAWAVMARRRRLYAVPAAVLVAILFILSDAPPLDLAGAWWPAPHAVMPAFTLGALVGIALPLFIVTMASQNIPGMAVLHVNEYRPAAGPLFATTGLFSLLAAPFGSHAVNLAAITAALCAGPEAGPDRSRRWLAAATAGAAYIVLGLLAGLAARLVAAAPPVLIEAVAGLALLGAFASSLANALAEPADREAAVVTFVTAASGISFLGIGGAFWGLLAGGAVMALTRWRRAS